MRACLADNNLGPEGAKFLAPALAGMKDLEQLSLTGTCDFSLAMTTIPRCVYLSGMSRDYPGVAGESLFVMQAT